MMMTSGRIDVRYDNGSGIVVLSGRITMETPKFLRIEYRDPHATRSATRWIPISRIYSLEEGRS